MKKKKINIAIVGLGNIGSYLYQYLEKNKKNIKKKTNVDINILLVCARNKKKIGALKYQKTNGAIVIWRPLQTRTLI